MSSIKIDLDHLLTELAHWGEKNQFLKEKKLIPISFTVNVENYSFRKKNRSTSRPEPTLLAGVESLSTPATLTRNEKLHSQR